MSRQATPRGFWAVWTAVAVDLLGFGIIIPILPLYAERFGASPVTIGLLFASYSLAQFVFSPIWGRVSDRVGRRPILLIAIAGSAVGSLTLGLAGSLPMLFVGRIIDGASGASVAVARATVADIADPGQRPRLMGLLGAAFGLGFVIGPSIGALAALGFPGLPFLVAAAISVANLAAGAIRIPETLQSVVVAPESPGFRSLPSPVLRLVLLTFVGSHRLRGLRSDLLAAGQLPAGYDRVDRCPGLRRGGPGPGRHPGGAGRAGGREDG
jgi:MFS transporter, DHA1 family, tetracycline resistance protein